MVSACFEQGGVRVPVRFLLKLEYHLNFESQILERCKATIGSTLFSSIGKKYVHIEANRGQTLTKTEAF